MIMLILEDMHVTTQLPSQFRTQKTVKNCSGLFYMGVTLVTTIKKSTLEEE